MTTPPPPKEKHNYQILPTKLLLNTCTCIVPSCITMQRH